MYTLQASLSHTLTPIGSAIDSYGRKKVLIVGTIISSLARGLVALTPSKQSYFAYRCMNMVGMYSIMHAMGKDLWLVALQTY